jgi:predicted methyltransferase
MYVPPIDGFAARHAFLRLAAGWLALLAMAAFAQDAPYGRVRATSDGIGKTWPASIDLALMVDVYHELEFPHEMLQATIHALRPGGRLVLVEYRAEDRGLDLKPLHKMSEKQIRREVESAALRWERTASSLPLQHLVVFRKAGVGPVDSTARGDHDGVD